MNLWVFIVNNSFVAIIVVFAMLDCHFVIMRESFDWSVFFRLNFFVLLIPEWNEGTLLINVEHFYAIIFIYSFYSIIYVESFDYLSDDSGE